MTPWRPCSTKPSTPHRRTWPLPRISCRGSAPNSYFMRRAAELGRGTFTEIGSEEQVLERMSALFTKLEKPVMVGLKAEWPNGASVEGWPDPLPDLYAGEPVGLSATVGEISG